MRPPRYSSYRHSRATRADREGAPSRKTRPTCVRGGMHRSRAPAGARARCSADVVDRVLHGVMLGLEDVAYRRVLAVVVLHLALQL